jgi:hypothetical protein
LPRRLRADAGAPGPALRRPCLQRTSDEFPPGVELGAPRGCALATPAAPFRVSTLLYCCVLLTWRSSSRGCQRLTTRTFLFRGTLRRRSYGSAPGCGRGVSGSNGEVRWAENLQGGWRPPWVPLDPGRRKPPGQGPWRRLRVISSLRESVGSCGTKYRYALPSAVRRRRCGPRPSPLALPFRCSRASSVS